MKIQFSRKSGFTLIEIMIVVGIMGLLAAIAIPSFIKAKSASRKSTCINNLRQIDAAKQQWATETSQPITATPGLPQIEPYLNRGVVVPGSVVCPQDAARSFATSYVIGNMTTPAACSIEPVLHSLP